MAPIQRRRGARRRASGRAPAARRIAVAGAAAAALASTVLAGAATAAPRSLDLAVTQLTGTPSFDAGAGPGRDTSAGDDVVRSNDRVTYQIEFNVNDDAAGSSVGRNVTITQTLPDGMSWTRLPATCLTDGVMPVSKIDGRTIVCNVGDVPTGTARTLSLQAKVDELTNGTVIAPAAGSVTVVADGASERAATPAPVTVSSVPRVDMVKSAPTVSETVRDGVAGYLLRYPVAVRIPDFGGRGLIGYEPPAAHISFVDEFTQVSPHAQFVDCAAGSDGAWSCAPDGDGRVGLDVTLRDPNRTSAQTLASTTVTVFVPRSDVQEAGGQLQTRNEVVELDAKGPDGTPAVGEDPGNNLAQATLSLSANGDFFKHYVDLTAPGRYVPGGANVDRNGFSVVSPGQVFQAEIRAASRNPIAGYEQVVACDVFDTTTQEATTAGAAANGRVAWVTTNSVTGGSQLVAGTDFVIEYSTAPTSTAADELARWEALRATDCGGDAAQWSTTPPADPATITKVRVRTLRTPPKQFTLAIAVNLRAKRGADGTKIANFMTYSVDGEPWAPSTYKPERHTGVRGDRLILSSAQTILSKEIVDPASSSTATPAVRGGTSVKFALRPQVVVPSQLDPGTVATARDVTVTDVLPAGTELSDEPGQEPSHKPQSVVRNPDGTTTVVWSLGTLTSEERPEITYWARISTTAAGAKVNRAIVASPDDVGSPTTVPTGGSDPHYAARTVLVDVLTGIQVDKSVRERFVEPGDAMTFEVTYANLYQEPHRGFDVIDVLPFAGDGEAAGQVPGRNPGSAFHGGVTLRSVEVQDGETVRYTDADPAAVYATYDPSAAGRARYGALPDGKRWCTAEQVESEQAGCPSAVGEATAIRVTRDGELGAFESRTFAYTIATDGNRSGDRYSNTAALRSADITLGTLSPTRTVRVVASQIGDYVWHDLDRDGRQDDGEPGVPGVGVTLEGVDKHGREVRVHATTGPDGRYRFTSSTQDGQDAGVLDLVSGDYRVVFDPQTLPEGTAFTARHADGTTAADDSDADPQSGATERIELPNPAPTEADGEDLTLDAGIVTLPAPPEEPSEPTPPTEPPVDPPTPPVTPPTPPVTPPEGGVKGTTRSGGPRLAVAKRANRRAVKPGQQVRYAIVVRNRGNEVARGVWVCDQLPRQVTLVRSAGGRLRDGRLCWTVTLKPRAARTLTLVVRVDRDARPTARMRNVAVATLGRQRPRAHADVRVNAAPVKPTRSAVTG